MQIVDSLTHLFPALIGICYYLFTFRSHSLAQKYLLVSILLLFMSSLYHLSQHYNWQLGALIFGRLDHIMIWILFGTSAFFINLIHLPKHRQNFYNGFLLTLVTCGIWLKSLYFENLLGWPGFILYFFVIGVGSISLIEIIRSKGLKTLTPYAISVLFFATGGLGERLGILSHAIFHIAVLLGLYFFWKALPKYA